MPARTEPTPVPMDGTMPAWWTLLQKQGLPTTVVTLDAETYFDSEYRMKGKDKKGLSTIEYITDKRFEFIGWSVTDISQPFAEPQPTFWWADDKRIDIIHELRNQYGRNLENCTVLMQNARFDATLLRVHHGFVPTNIIDTMQLGAHENARGSQSMKDMAKRFGLPGKGDTMQFKGLHLKTKLQKNPSGPPTMLWRGMTAAERSAMVEYACLDGILTWELFIRLLPMLPAARLGTELALMRHTLTMFLRPLLRIDTVYGAELVGKLRGKVDDLLARVGHARDEISGNMSFKQILTDALAAADDDVNKYVKPNKKGEMILAIAKTDEQLTKLLNHKDEHVRLLVETRTGLKSWPNHANRVQSILDQAAANGGDLCVPLKYSGAHTHRWSGQEGINLQNLPSRATGEAEILNTMRHLLIPPPGKVLVVVDASQVEARGLSWIAGQEDLNQLFRDGEEIYCNYASKMLGGKPLRKSRKTDPPAVKKYLDRMRNMGKVEVLGGGYGMGWKRCVDFARDTYGVILSDVEAVTLINSYRESVPQITRFWSDIEQAFTYTARYHEPCEMARGLKFYYESLFDQTIIELPSGNTLRYQGVHISRDYRGRERLWMPDPSKQDKGTIDMWGGYLTENVVQAMCRDLLGEVVLKTEDRGFPVVLHTHDEIITVVDEADGERCLAGLIEDFRCEPEWAPGIPLDAEGKIMRRYEK